MSNVPALRKSRAAQRRQRTRLHKQPLQREDIFILCDTSGSMSQNKKIDRAIEALETVASQFPGTEIWEFGGYRVNKVDHKDIDTLLPSGMTPMFAALKEIIEAENAKHIIIVTDGHPTDVDPNIICTWANNYKEVKIDAIAIGDDANHDFLNRLCSSHRGGFKKVNAFAELLTNNVLLLVDQRSPQDVNTPIVL